MQERIKSLLNKHLRLMLIVTISMVVISEVLFYTIFETLDFPLRKWLIVFYSVFMCVLHVWLCASALKTPTKFQNTILIQSTVKMLFFLATAVVYALFYRDYVLNFGIYLLVIYLVISVVDAAGRLRLVKEISKGQKTSQDE